MKKALATLVASIITMTTLPVYATQGVLFINEVPYPVSQIDGVCYIPFRTVLEALCFDISWDSETKVVVAKSSNQTITLDTKYDTIYTNDSSEFQLPYPVRFINDTIYIPINNPLGDDNRTIIDFVFPSR